MNSPSQSSEALKKQNASSRIDDFGATRQLCDLRTGGQAMEEVKAAGGPLSKKRARRSGWLVGVVLLGLIAAGLYLHRYAPDRAVQAALIGEDDAKLTVHRRDLLGGDALVVDLRSVGDEASMASVTRILLKAAEALKDEKYDRVYLAYAGNEKFFFEGSYFKQIGEERSWQNPVYTIRTLPENARKPDGSQAFQTWTGGWLGVLGQQLEDSNKFHRQWWVDDALGGAKAAV